MSESALVLLVTAVLGACSGALFFVFTYMLQHVREEEQ